MRLALAFLLLAGAGFAQPRRIVSTTPSITEMLFAVGVGDRVVGVTTFCRYPEEARKLTEIGSYTEPNYEAILHLRPELVIIQENPIAMAAKLQGMGVRVLELKHTTVDDIFTSLTRIGQVTGAVEKAQAVVGTIRSNLEAIRAPLREVAAHKLAVHHRPYPQCAGRPHSRWTSLLSRRVARYRRWPKRAVEMPSPRIPRCRSRKSSPAILK